MFEEREILPHDERWTDYLEDVRAWEETPVKEPAELTSGVSDANFETWRATNLYRQKQKGYAVATVALPLGDITSWQMRQLADIARKYCGDNIRTTVEQNIVLRWVAEADLPALYEDLKNVGLDQPGAGTIFDVVACPGTDTCKLGIASSRGLAGELHERLATKYQQYDSAIQGLKIKISGCFNSCGQHHLADLGFYGVSRKVGGTTVPHFRVVLGGQWENNGGSYGITIGAVPSKRVPDFIDEITDRYLKEREGDKEDFQAFIQRIRKARTEKDCSTSSRPCRRMNWTRVTIRTGAIHVNTALATSVSVNVPAKSCHVSISICRMPSACISRPSLPMKRVTTRKLMKPRLPP
ncbi:MAG: hypothetical protein U5P41_05630 [Gammaproteobacteria bacterium]|nr:hypothetical protein [Gammaproteobacteria bacterium]